MALPFGSRVFGVAVVVQTAFIAHADGVGIVPTGVDADPLDRACGKDAAVATDVEVIACAVKSASTMCRLQSLLGKGTVLARGAAMYHDQINASHRRYKFEPVMACVLKAPSKAEAKAMISFNTLSQVVDFCFMVFRELVCG